MVKYGIVMTVLALLGLCFAFMPSTPDETRRCKVCAKSCCPDTKNCSCLSKDFCNCIDPDIPAPR